MKCFVMGMALTLVGTVPAGAGPVLDAVKTNGVLACGLSTGLVGFATADKDAKATGLDADICRGVAAAIFGTPDKVKFVAVPPEQRVSALQTGQVDLEVLDPSLISTRSGDRSLAFAPAVFYDGAGFLVPKSLGVKSARQLAGAAVCLQQGTSNEQHLTDYFHSNKLDLRVVQMRNAAEIEAAFFFGRCDAYMTDVITLANMRINKAPNPDDYTILPERISKSQLAPALRGGDKGFYNLVRWTIYTLIEAEERGVTAHNVAEMAKSDDPGIRHLFSTEPDTDKALPPDDKRALNVIKSVGNYGEIFARNIGDQSILHLARGQNALYLTTLGGQMLSPQSQSTD
jgi:general L-amino acid transport system substrate-binding protein